jgi:hypothetical protein
MTTPSRPSSGTTRSTTTRRLTSKLFLSSDSWNETKRISKNPFDFCLFSQTLPRSKSRRTWESTCANCTDGSGHASKLLFNVSFVSCLCVLSTVRLSKPLGLASPIAFSRLLGPCYRTDAPSLRSCLRRLCACITLPFSLGCPMCLPGLLL